MKAKLSVSFMLSGWKIPKPHSRHPIQVSLLPGPGRERDEGVVVLVLHVVRVEAVWVEGPGVGPDEVVVVKVDDVNGTYRANGERHSLHGDWLGETARDVRHRTVQSHAFLDHHRQVV